MKKILLIIAMAMAGIAAMAQEDSTTLHLIVAAATNDQSVGKSVGCDMERTTTEFSQIASELGIGYHEVVIADNDFGKRNVEKAINELSPRPNDIVTFVYCGHGFRFSDDTDEYPRMLLKCNSKTLMDGDYMSTTEVYDILQAKKARLTLVFTDCCNTDLGICREEVEEDNLFNRRDLDYTRDTEKLRELFLKQSGSVRATAAMPGQKAYCSSDGGYLITGLLGNIKNITSADKNEAPSWSAIINKTNNFVMKKAALALDDMDGEAPQIMVRSIKLSNEPEASGAAYSDAKSGIMGSVDTARKDDSGTMLLILIGAATLCAAIAISVIVKNKKKSNK